MRSLSRLIRENPGTTAMLLSSTALFSAIFFLASSPENRADRLETPPAFSSEELKQKEETVKRRLEAQPALATSVSLGMLGLLIAGLAIDISLIRRWLRGRAWIEAPQARPVVFWGRKQLFQAAVFVFFAEGCLFLAHVGFYMATGIEFSEDLLLVFTSLGRDLMVALFVVAVVLRAGGRPVRDLGLDLSQLGRKIRLGVLSYLAVIPLLVLSLVALAGVASFFSYEPQPQNVVQMYLKPEMGPYLLMFSVFVAVIGPAMEELFFRGFIYAGLRRDLGAGKAAMLTAGAFALFHLSVFAFVPVFLLGLLLCYLYERSGSLLPPVFAHVLHNTLMVVFTLGFRSLAAG